MSSYVSHHGPRDHCPNGYVTSPTDKTQRSGYITIASITRRARSSIDTATLHPAKDLLHSARG